MRRYNTIIFVPHAKARFRKISISNRLLVASAAAAGGVLLAAIAFGWAYVSSGHQDARYRLALAENARLKTSTQLLSRRLDGITRQLSDFEDRTRRLQIVAGLPEIRGAGGPFAPVSGPLSHRSAWLDTSLSDLEVQFARRQALASSTPTVAPVRGLYNSGFGSRRDPLTGSAAFHQGLDISTRRHEKVLATAGGVVVKSGWSGDYGKMVEIAHAAGYRTIYGHLHEISVQDGQRVRRGDQVGLVGSTGRSTGTHLHYEVRRGDRPVNPLEYILDGR